MRASNEFGLFQTLILVSMLAGCAARPASNPVKPDIAAACRADLEAIPAFLLENDTGAKDHLAHKGQAAMDAALDQARVEAGKVEDLDSCKRVLNTYLGAWRSGHLAVLGQGEFGKQAAPSPIEEEDARRPQFKALSPKTALLTLPSFSPAYRSSMIALLTRHRKELQARPYWIVDVRENGGGSDSTYAPLLPWLMNNERVEVGAEWLVTPHNIAAQETICAKFAPGDAECESFMKRAVDSMRGAPAGSYVGMEGYDASGLKFERSEQLEPRRPKRVAVLMDGNCGSSCEQFLLTLRQSFSVKLVGRPSNGALDYSNLRAFELPSGERELFYATSRSQRLPQVPVDLTGVLPDIYLPKPKDENERNEEVQRVRRWLEGGSLAPAAK